MSIYFEASKIIKAVNSKKGSIKSLVFASDVKNKKGLYALVCQCIKYWDVLQALVEKCKLLKLEKGLRNDDHLAAVLLYDHVMGRGVSGKFKECIHKHKASIHAQCEMLKIKKGVTDLKQLISDNTQTDGIQIPKYVRMNTILTDTDSVIQQFIQGGYTLVPCDKDSYFRVVSSLTAKQFIIDVHIPDLLVFPTSTDFHKHPLYTAGKIILQDKASCFPAYILSPEVGSSVIDCCAAPGNKTSHLASIMKNKGTVYAFDKDQKRLGTLRQLTKKAGATCVVPACRDFLSIDPHDTQYRGVQYVLVDPSCSGSGMVNRLNQRTDEAESSSKHRLQKLGRFQISIVKHALCFPNVNRVTYSTCSIHQEENEMVVEEVLSHFKGKFEMKNIMPDWPFRGVKGYEHAQYCVRMSHDKALTNGFFVACFERKRAHNVSNIATSSEIVEKESKGNIESENDETVTSLKRKKIRTTNMCTNGDTSDSKQVKLSKKKQKKKQKAHLLENETQCNDGQSNNELLTIGHKTETLSTEEKSFDQNGSHINKQLNKKHKNACKKKRKKEKKKTATCL